MISENFGFLDVNRQQELVEIHGIFIRTQLIGEYLCDIYFYDTYYVLFFYLLNQFKTIRSKCFSTLDHIELFIEAVERPGN